MENRRNFIIGLSAGVLLGGCESITDTGDTPPEGASSWNLPTRRAGERFSYRYRNPNGTTGVNSYRLLDTSTFRGRPAYRYRAEWGRDGGATVQGYRFVDVETMNFMGSTDLSGEAIWREFKPHNGILDFPLFVGKRYNVLYDRTNHERRQTRSVRSSVSVQALETVTVPAGTFETLRLRHSGRNRNFVWHWWYAPEIGRWIRDENARNPNGQFWELLDYRA